jgi:FAD/FMN-containing dehydrogenase
MKPSLVAATVGQLLGLHGQRYTAERVRSELGPLLSSQASIFGPDDGRWATTTERYSTLGKPEVHVVVQAGTEDDVASIVRYANEQALPFMVVNRGHALTATVSSFRGIQIDMKALTGITVQEDGKTAWMQGGAYNGAVIDELWEAGYVASTGSCSCVGMVGPMLGGGHGRYQGLYGLLADNVVNLDVVLADGTPVRANASNEYSDLFWAMRGAGHNFGAVTRFEMAIHPKGELPDWYYHNYIYSADKLEALFEALNVFQDNGTTPPLMALNEGIFVVDANFGAEPTIFWSFAYAGPTEDAEAHLAPFNALGALWEETGSVALPGLAAVQKTGMDDELCAGGRTHIMSTAGIQTYNVTAQRKIYDLYARNVALHPELGGTWVLHEGYSVAAVRRPDPASMAYPHRDDHLLMLFDAGIPDDSPLRGFVEAWAAETRDLWNEGQPGRRPTTYMPYAAGYESLESMYGYEPWRLERLRALKAKYDPQNRFGYYNPIPLPEGGDVTKSEAASEEVREPTARSEL